MGRQPHHPPLAEGFETAPSAPENPTPVEAMAHRLKTPEGRKLYAQRKHTPEPVFGIVKSALGFRQFSLASVDQRAGAGGQHQRLRGARAWAPADSLGQIRVALPLAPYRPFRALCEPPGRTS